MSIRLAENKASKVLELVWDGKFPVDPVALANNLLKKVPDTNSKVPIEMLAATNTQLNGASGMAQLKLDNDSPECFVCTYNGDEALVRQRFTQAHELGHVILNHVNKSTLQMRDVRFENRNSVEREANAFAAELLMPARWLPQLYRDAKSASELAHTLGVSVTALRYRLKNLGLL